MVLELLTVPSQPKHWSVPPHTPHTSMPLVAGSSVAPSTHTPHLRRSHRAAKYGAVREARGQRLSGSWVHDFPNPLRSFEQDRGSRELQSRSHHVEKSYSIVGLWFEPTFGLYGSHRLVYMETTRWIVSIILDIIFMLLKEAIYKKKLIHFVWSCTSVIVKEAERCLNRNIIN